MLFWSHQQRQRGLRSIDRIYSVCEVPAGPRPLPLEHGEPLVFDFDIDEHMRRQRNAGLMILQAGVVRFERYCDGYGPEGRWTSFSLAKSITSTLVGAAILDGSIGSIDDRVIDYLPGLAGSAYDDVTIRHMLTMTSGVQWDETYDDPRADVAQFWAQTPDPDVDNMTAYMRRLDKAAPAGSVWLYSTGETNLLAAALASATGRTLSAYLAEKIWQPLAMERNAAWILAADGREVGGCCVSVGLRDYARFGQFVLDGAVINGASIVPEGWLLEATTKQADIGKPGHGYGYCWWTNDDGSFDARGIFGQGIFIDPKTKLVIASSGNWPNAIEDEGLGPERQEFYRRVRNLVAR
jgi:CubicO group peptidase (beta-lactamase class C family)